MLRISPSVFVVHAPCDLNEICNTLSKELNGSLFNVTYSITVRGNGNYSYPFVLIFDLPSPDVLSVQGELSLSAEARSSLTANIESVDAAFKGYDFTIRDTMVVTGTDACSLSADVNVESDGESFDSNSGNGSKNGYIQAQLHPQDAAIVNDWLKRTGVVNPIDANELHATLFYAQSDIPELEIDSNAVYLARVKPEIILMGEDGSKWQALTVHLQGDELAERHEQIKQQSGGEHSYPDYQAHLSLKYEPVAGDMEKLSSLPFPLDSLRFTNESQEDIRP